jgi:hydrogenase maturation protease
MRRAEELLEGHPAAASIELIQDFQLQIEHALDLQGVDLALFLDASVSAAAPFTFTRLASSQDNSYTTHELSPSSVLHVYGQMNLGPAPPSFLLSVRAEQFELGTDLAPAAQANLEAAWALLLQLFAHLEVPFWEARVTPGATSHA